MPPEPRKLLIDVREAAQSIADFASGKSLPDFIQDKLLRSALYYQFVIVGEALSRLRTVDDETADRISECRRIVGFRNQIIHGYAKIDDEITWRIIQDKLPILQSEVERLLAE